MGIQNEDLTRIMCENSRCHSQAVLDMMNEAWSIVVENMLFVIIQYLQNFSAD